MSATSPPSARSWGTCSRRTSAKHPKRLTPARRRAAAPPRRPASRGVRSHRPRRRLQRRRRQRRRPPRRGQQRKRAPRPSRGRVAASAMVRVFEGGNDASGLRFAVVVSRFNTPISDRLLDGALRTLAECGAADDAVEVFWVPGAFEIPLVARSAAESQRYGRRPLPGRGHPRRDRSLSPGRRSGGPRDRGRRGRHRGALHLRSPCDPDDRPGGRARPAANPAIKGKRPPARRLRWRGSCARASARVRGKVAVVTRNFVGFRHKVLDPAARRS